MHFARMNMHINRFL